MKLLVLTLACFACFAAATRETDFHANHAWWTNLDSVHPDTSTDRRTCYVSGLNTSCDTSTETWNHMRSYTLPTTNAASYSGTVTNYKVCRKQSTDYYYRLDTTCLSGWTQTNSLYLITNPLSWLDSFTVSGTTYVRRQFYVFTTDSTPLVSHLIIPAEEFDPPTAYYTYSFFFHAYYWPE